MPVASVAGMFLAAMCVASTATGFASCEESNLVQLRKSNLVTNRIAGSLEHAEELVVQLRQLAMGKASNGSLQPNYTVFRLDENASETTLQIINDSMETFLEQVNTSFHNDLQEIQMFIQNANECNQELSDRQEDLGLNVTSVNGNVVALEEDHDVCRASENFTYQANLTAFNALKSRVDLQLQRAEEDESQVPEVRCMRNYIRPIDPPFSQDFSQPSEYSDAATCAEVIRDWSSNYSAEVGGRLTSYTSANQAHADKIAECNTLQGDYEESFCSYKSNLLYVCGELDRCFGHVQALYTATSQLILQSNETRFRSFLVAKKVVCYINVLLRNLTIAAIHECDQKQIDTSELDFTFESLPTKAACDVSLVSVSPCDNQWIQTKYTNKSWYVTGAVQNAPCEPCGVATTTTTSVTATCPQKGKTVDQVGGSVAPELHREVSYALAAVAEASEGAEGPIACKTRVEGLMPNARYAFMLAACNGAGTSRWSPLSAFLQTPAAPPQSPVNTVATVAQDAEQQVVVTISWECPPELPGSGSVCAFDLQMLPVEMQQVRPSSDRRLVRERVATARPGDRICWAKALTAPGCYVIEVATESSNGQKSAPAVLTLEAPPEAFPPSLADLMVPPKWSDEPYLALGPAAEGVPRFGNLEGTWLQTLLLWGDNALGVEKSARTLSSSIDVLCFFRRPGSSQVFRATLASEVTTSRLQVALPTHVPMSLRLAVKLDPKSAARTSRQPMSEPLAIMFNDDGEPLQPTWEIWARNHPDGQPARWTSIPQELQHCIEAAWLEGHPKVALQLPHATEGRMAPGSYELTFGDERQTQSTVKKLGPGGWTAKARRSVLSNEDDTVAVAASTDELCVICMERRRTHAFMHADTGDGHLAVCVDCAEAYRAEAAVPGGARAVRNCPMCRRSFSAIHRIYQ